MRHWQRKKSKRYNREVAICTDHGWMVQLSGGMSGQDCRRTLQGTMNQSARPLQDTMKQCNWQSTAAVSTRARHQKFDSDVELSIFISAGQRCACGSREQTRLALHAHWCILSGDATIHRGWASYQVMSQLWRLRILCTAARMPALALRSWERCGVSTEHLHWELQSAARGSAHCLACRTCASSP